MFGLSKRERDRKKLERMTRNLVEAVAFLDSRLDIKHVPRAERRAMFRAAVSGSDSLADLMDGLLKSVQERLSR